MGRIYYIMGKSASGKDTIFRELKELLPEFRTVVLYTTRPARAGERDGVEYFFVSEDTLKIYEKKEKVIELRTYNTIHGAWKYATIDDGQVNLEEADYFMMGTLESYAKIREYYGSERVVPVYIEIDDGERLLRAVLREREQEMPRYAELCRRFLADIEDFSEENLQKAGITRRFHNIDRLQCIEEIIGEIQHGKL